MYFHGLKFSLERVQNETLPNETNLLYGINKQGTFQILVSDPSQLIIVGTKPNTL